MSVFSSRISPLSRREAAPFFFLKKIQRLIIPLFALYNGGLDRVFMKLNITQFSRNPANKSFVPNRRCEKEGLY